MKQFLYETVAEKEEEGKRNVKISFNIFSKPIINIPHVPFLKQAISFTKARNNPSPSLELLSFEKGGSPRDSYKIYSLIATRKHKTNLFIDYHLSLARSRCFSVSKRPKIEAIRRNFVAIYTRTWQLRQGPKCLETNYRHLELRFNVSGTVGRDGRR